MKIWLNVGKIVILLVASCLLYTILEFTVEFPMTYVYQSLRRNAGLQQRLPGGIIVGVSKCGTRAVLNFLSIHPGVSCGTVDQPIPEINYFSHHYEQGLEWYRKQFPPSLPGQLTVEKSPRYFKIPGVPERIRRYNRTVKLMVVVCDPVIRFESQSAQNARNEHTRHIPFRSIDDRALRDATNHSLNNTELWHGCYFDRMAYWYKTFPTSQILIIDGDKLRHDPYPQMMEVETFLGLDKFFTQSNFYFNKTKGFYCPSANGVVQCLGNNKGRKHAKMSPAVEARVRQYYKQCNRPFLELVSNTFDWL